MVCYCNRLIWLPLCNYPFFHAANFS
jgi:hypothetical protein